MENSEGVLVLGELSSMAINGATGKMVVEEFVSSGPVLHDQVVLPLCVGLIQSGSCQFDGLVEELP